MNTTNKPRPTGRSEQRRQELRRNIPRPTATLRRALRKPEFVRSAAIILVFLIITSFLVAWAREQVLVYPGLVAKDAKLTRLDYQVENEQATKTKRDEAMSFFSPNKA